MLDLSGTTLSHDMVVHHHNRATGLTMVLAVHRLAAGRSIGGCRMRPYESLEAATVDAMRLADAMSKKNALAGVPYGGAKAVVIADPAQDKTPELLRSIGEFVERFNGLYITAPDSGISTDDLLQIESATRWVVGARQPAAPYTAAGVLEGLHTAVDFRFGSRSLDGVRVGVQGVGNVGGELCSLLAAAGAELTIADIDAHQVDAVAQRWGARVVTPDEIVAADVDVVAPCGLGGSLTNETVAAIRAQVIAGAANNQVSEPSVGESLRARGIVYAPDFLINAGGVIAGAAEVDGFDHGAVMATIAGIGGTLREVLARAAESGRPSSVIAEELAEERFALREGK